jgi:hypothetical protein
MRNQKIMFNKISRSTPNPQNSLTVEEKINELEAKINSFVTLNEELEGKFRKISILDEKLESEGGSFKAIQTCQFKLPKIQKQILGNARKMVYLQNKLKQAISIKKHSDEYRQRQQAIPGFIRQVQLALPQQIILGPQPLPQIPVLIHQVQQAIPRFIKQVKIQKAEKKAPLTFWQSLNTNRTVNDITYIASRSFAIHAATTLVVALLWPRNEDEKEAGNGGGGDPLFDPKAAASRRTGASFPSPAPYIPFTPPSFPELPKISNTPPAFDNPAPIQTIFTVSQIKKIANDYLESIGVPGAIISWFLYIIYSIIDKIKHHGKVLIEFAITRGKWGVPHIHTKWL